MGKILDWGKYCDKAVEAIGEGVVLLENKNNALPLDKNMTIAVFGRIQTDYYKSGTGSGGMVNVAHVIDIPEGLERRGAKLDEELKAVYKQWIEEHPFDRGARWGGEPWSQEEMPLDDALVEKVAERCDTALCVIGRTAGEEMDNSKTGGSWYLTGLENEMLKITRKHFKKQVIVLNVGSVIDMNFVDEIGPDAVLYAWQGGMMGGLGTADVLLGNVNPSGRLADTIAYRIEDYPSDKYFGDGDKDIYCEDIYVGYRYFETFAKEKVRYPFGYGLSYTDFKLDPVKLDVWGLSGKGSTAAFSDITIKVTVTNTGKAAGKDVVQIYCAAPQGALGKPARALCGFGKTGLLQSGESEELSITVNFESIASYDDSGASGHRYAYVLEKGEYVFYAGENVRDTAGSVKLTIDETVALRVTGSALAPVTPFERMVNRDGSISFEPVPLSEIDENKRRFDGMPTEISFTGDKGIKLKDVVEGSFTLDEFIAQLADEDLACIIRGEGMGSPKVTAGTASAFGGVSKRLAEFGIPCGCCSDGPSGMRLDCGTKAFSLPGGAMLACTWNRELLTELFEFTGLEMTANNVECLLGPGINIHRHPLNGRNFEYFSEDPFVTGEIAAAELIGLQKGGTTGTIKHFCGNNRETKRHFMDSVISERALREIYLRGFEIAVKKGGAVTVMTTYGSVNGLWTAGNYDLVTTILRNEWGFTGFAMTDWWANINRRGQAPDKTDLAAMAMAQNDVYMVCADSEEHEDNILTSLEKGELKRAELQRNAANILRVLMNTNAMKRLMGTDKSVSIIGCGADSDIDSRNVPCFVMDEELTVDLQSVKVVRDSNYSFILDLQKTGMVEFTLTAKSSASETAQMPVTVFSMGTASGSFTWNGTGGEPVSFSGKTFMFSKHTTIRLYFAQAGLELIEMKFKLLK
ncbi:MAG: glycoside hydrolase family 3 C-terminal domain-containing protein [Lachnospiraceae bacterium]|nr:glycoside hydrolase family 3 C-terminal domain-containing protein [Lachnospiraceae bacterium]